jgi:DNA-directed RNA polymerase subunit RPC12/RpoP
MVELIAPKCPRCGADLQLRPGQESAVCNYCESSVLIVDRDASSGADDAFRTGLEKKKLALELQNKELGELSGQLDRAMMERSMMEGRANRRKNLAGIYVIFGMGLIFGVTMFPIFYLLDLYTAYGITKDMCLVYWILIMVLSLAAIIATKLASDRALESQRHQCLQSPEYFAGVAEVQQLQARVDRQRTAVEQAEQQLKALL